MEKIIILTNRELKVISKVLTDKAKELRKRKDYYQNDKVQADYFEIDVIAMKTGLMSLSSNTFEDDI